MDVKYGGLVVSGWQWRTEKIRKEHVKYKNHP